MTPVALKSEIQSDPLSLGYAVRVTSGDDAGIAAILNALTGSGSASIAVSSLTRDQMLTGLRPSLLSLPSLSAAIQAKWDRVKGDVQAATTVQVDATTQYLFTQAVVDGVLIQAQADAAWHRIGSRAEVLFGDGSLVSTSDVSFALRGAR